MLVNAVTLKEDDDDEEPAVSRERGSVAPPPNDNNAEFREEVDKTAGKSREGQTADFQGFLKKKGDQGRIKLFKKRHFRLYKNEGVIAYFKNETDNEQIGEINVTGAFLVEKREDLGKNVFSITMKTTARVWILQAPDEATMAEWIDLVKPLMKESAPTISSGGKGKKPPKPAPGLPLKYPPTYVQGFTEREECLSVIQDGELDWTKLSHKQVRKQEPKDGMVSIAIHENDGFVEEVRAVKLDNNEGCLLDLPKQLKYSAESVSWVSSNSHLVYSHFVADEKTQRDYLKKIVGYNVTCKVPSVGVGHAEDNGKRQETRLNGGGPGTQDQGGQLVFPAEAEFSGKLFYDQWDDRYALVDEKNNGVHFLNSTDARSIFLKDANAPKEILEEAFRSPRIYGKFHADGANIMGALSYRLKDTFSLFCTYTLVLEADEQKGHLQGWWSVKNNTSKEFKDALLTMVPDPSARKDREEEDESELEKAAKKEATKEATKKIGGGAMNLLGALMKKDDDAPPPPPKKHHYKVPLATTLPPYDWAHTAFVNAHAQTSSFHLATFDTPEYAIKPIIDKAAGTDAKGAVNTSVRLTNPLQLDALPPGKMTILRKDPCSVGVVKVSDVSTAHLEGGEILTIPLGETIGVSASRVQTGYNFDADKHFIIETFEIKVVNGRQETVEVTIEDSMFRWSTFEIPFSKPAHTTTSHPRIISWKLKLNHGEDATIKYTVFYSTFILDSDFDQSN